MIRKALYYSFAFTLIWISTPTQAAEGQTPKSSMIADFDSESLVNNLGGESGSWNLNPYDNDAYTDVEVVKALGLDGKETGVCRLDYSVDSVSPSKNGFWTKLMQFNARDYDHLQFDIKGDSEKGFTEKIRIEIKKYKTPENKVDKLVGTYEIPVTDQWQRVKVPLNAMTGVMDLTNPKTWEDPKISHEYLDEFVIVFNDRHVTKKTGAILLDNIQFIETGEPGPLVMDFPPRKKEKTETKIEGFEFTKFLRSRLKGFPTKSVVKKDFPEDETEFLLEVAEDTWRFFDEIVDKDHAFPLDTIQIADGEEAFADGAWIGDYTNVTNVGVYLMVLVAAYDLGFITEGDAVKRIQKTLNSVETMEYHKDSGFPYNYYDTTTLERTSYFVSLVDSGWLWAGLYVVKNAFPEQVSSQAQKLIDRGSFDFFYDEVERQFFHGYYEHLEVYSDYHYGVFYSEPRAASYLAIAQEDVPKEHWFEGLVRTFKPEFTWQGQEPKNRVTKETLGYKYFGGYYEWKDLKYVPSWGGSAFEALMPTLILKEKEFAPEGLGLNNANHVQGQIRYAMEKLGMPVWGMSPSSVPEGGYSEYGAKAFGSKGYKGGVATPHASILALEYAPKEVMANMRKMVELYDIYGEYGYYDAVTVKTGKVARKYLALDQGMILVAICNYLTEGSIRDRFHSDPIMKNAEDLLRAEKLFEPAPTADAS